MAAQYDVIVIGSGAGGGSVAYKLVNAGKRVLLVEKGPFLPRDASTLEVREVFVDGVFKNHVVWLDSKGQRFRPRRVLQRWRQDQVVWRGAVPLPPRGVRSGPRLRRARLAVRL